MLLQHLNRFAASTAKRGRSLTTAYPLYSPSPLSFNATSGQQIRTFWWKDDDNSDDEKKRKDGDKGTKGSELRRETSNFADTPDGVTRKRAPLHIMGDKEFSEKNVIDVESTSESSATLASDKSSTSTTSTSDSSDTSTSDTTTNNDNSDNSDDTDSSSPAVVGEGENAPHVPSVMIIPRRGTPVFPVPELAQHLLISDPAVVARLEKQLVTGMPYIGVFMRKQDASVDTSQPPSADNTFDADDIVHNLSEIHEIGTLAQVAAIRQLPHFSAGEQGEEGGQGGEGGEQRKNWHVMLTGHRRIRFQRSDSTVLEQGPPMIIDIEHLATPDYDANDPVRILVFNFFHPLSLSLSRSPHFFLFFFFFSFSFPFLSPSPSRFHLLLLFFVVFGMQVLNATSQEIMNTIRDVMSGNEMLHGPVQDFMRRRIELQDPPRLADFAVSLTSAKPDELQNVMDALNVQERLDRALMLLKTEVERSRLRQSIKESVEKKIGESQRKYMLNEQLKEIKTELGLTKDDKESLLEKFRSRLEAKGVVVPEEARSVIDEEMSKLESLEKNSPEFNTTRNYMDWLTSIPWGVTSEENFDVKAAKIILDEDHYGMKDVKDRILETIAVGRLKGKVGQGKIICLSGPPGTGKTSIGKSIARALNREFFRFSVGGLSDVAEIKGHRRTYIGAMPGKLIQGLKKTGDFILVFFLSLVTIIYFLCTRHVVPV